MQRRHATFRLRVWNTPTRQTTGPQRSQWIDFVAFPRSYEVLYEIYHTTLMERIRMRRQRTYPSPSAMGRQFYNVRWKRQSAVLKRIDDDAGLHSLFPHSSRMLELSTTAGSTSVSDFNSTVRSTSDAKRVYESSTRRHWLVDAGMCQAHVSSRYCLFVTSLTVYNRFETCCADECNYLIKYARIFGENRQNCCTGCNRFRCQSNTRDVASTLAKDSTIVPPDKHASAPVMVSIVV